MRQISGINALTQTETIKLLDDELGWRPSHTGAMIRANSPNLPTAIVFGKRRFYLVPTVEKFIASERQRIAAVAASA